MASRSAAVGDDDDDDSAGFSGRLADPGDYLANFAATTIQRHFRGHRVRKEYHAKRSRIHALEQQWAQADSLATRLGRAARSIQTAWRGYRNSRIYRYYRDLIQFRERGDPRELLRVINPREGQLADAAAGVHVRFRLGGTVFPPLVFYKIFTHRTVVDICAFGPRDYAKEVRLTPAELHNKQLQATAAARSAAGGGAGGSAGGSQQARRSKRHHHYQEGEFALEDTLREYIKPDGTIGLRSTCGWYERHDNNGWRPVAERVLLDEDPITTMTRLRRQPDFHHNHLQRREDRIRKAKERKREWLWKMYGQGQGQGGARPGRPVGPDGVDFDALDDAALEGKMEELLSWSQHLDFGSYVNDWTSMATTLGSEAFGALDDEARYLTRIPGPPTDVRPDMHKAGAPMVPYKGGATAACGTTSSVAYA